MSKTRVLSALALAFLATGCTSARRTEPARTATEQLLISTAADRAAADLTLDGISGRTVALVDTRFEAYDKLYVISLLESRLLTLGAKVAKDPAKAEVVVEIRSGALSIDSNSWLLGIPELAVPFFGGPIPIPELALLKRDRMQGVAKLAWTAKTIDGALVGAAGPAYGHSHVTKWALFMIPFDYSDTLPQED
jgi:hypothetical protein